jgi:hypothetical protein
MAEKGDMFQEKGEVVLKKGTTGSPGNISLFHCHVNVATPP